MPPRRRRTEVLLSDRTAPRVNALYVVLERAADGEGVARYVSTVGDMPWITDDVRVADRMLALAKADNPTAADRLFVAVFARVEDVRTLHRPHGATAELIKASTALCERADVLAREAEVAIDDARRTRAMCQAGRL